MKPTALIVLLLTLAVPALAQYSPSLKTTGSAWLDVDVNDATSALYFGGYSTRLEWTGSDYFELTKGLILRFNLAMDGNSILNVGTIGQAQNAYHYINAGTNTAFLRYLANAAYLTSPRNLELTIGSAAGTRHFRVNSAGSPIFTIGDTGIVTAVNNIGTSEMFISSRSGVAVSALNGAVVSASASVVNASDSNNRTVGGNFTVKNNSYTYGSAFSMGQLLIGGNGLVIGYGGSSNGIIGSGAGQSIPIEGNLDFQLLDNDYSNITGANTIEAATGNFGYSQTASSYVTINQRVGGDSDVRGQAWVAAAPNSTTGVVRLQELDDRALVPIGPFSITSVARTSTVSYAGVLGGGISTRYYIPNKSRVKYITINMSPGATVGSATATVTLNGTPQTGADDPSAVLTSGVYAKGTATVEIDAAADDYLGVQFDTHSTFDFSAGPPSANAIVTIWIKPGKD